MSHLSLRNPKGGPHGAPTVDSLDDDIFTARNRSQNQNRKDGDDDDNHDNHDNDYNQSEGEDGGEMQIVFLVALIFRVANSLVVQTFFSPDEYWQALEPAHVAVYGYGVLTWEWAEGIRSFIHPLLYALLYKLLEILSLDNTFFLLLTPKLLGALFAAGGDYFTFRLAYLFFGSGPARWTLFCSMISWFNFYCLTRSFSNSLETVLTVAALSYWPWRDLQRKTSYLGRLVRLAGHSGHGVFRPRANNIRLATLLVALSCVIRPTSAIIWLPLYLDYFASHLFQLPTVLVSLMPIPLGVLVLSTVIDRFFWGSWVFTPLNFLRFNVLQNISIFYGSHSWHWYLSQGIPVVFLTFIPLMILGAVRSRNYDLLAPFVWTVLVYSCLGHKEFRFIFPLLPIGLTFSGYYLYSLVKIVPFKSVRLFGTRSPLNRTKLQPGSEGKKQALLIVMLTLTNIPLAMYASVVHQRGVVDVMNYLRQEGHQGRVDGIHFLMPCHSTPLQSHLHLNVPTTYISCEPPLHGESLETYLDESDIFFRDPVAALEAKPIPEVISHVVLFEALLPQVEAHLTGLGYSQCASFFNTHFSDDSRRRGQVLVWKRR